MTNPVQSGDLGASLRDTHRVAETPVVSGHTPGPWKIDYGHPRGLPGGISRAAAPWTAVTRFNTFARPTTPEALANARLIAVAPDLLEAARQAEQALLTFCDHYVIEDRDHDLAAERAIQAIRAAIAKATGETQ